MPSVLVINGSARDEGDTGRVIELLFPPGSATRINLCDLAIRHYEYNRSIEGDDFEFLVAALLRHDLLVFATPVYWYAMSGLMKVAFDRLTDLVTVRKDLGRQLRGRTIFLVACGADRDLPEGFEVPFRRTAEYLGMKYGGAFYADTTDHVLNSAELESNARAFSQRVFAAP